MSNPNHSPAGYYEPNVPRRRLTTGENRKLDLHDEMAYTRDPHIHRADTFARTYPNRVVYSVPMQNAPGNYFRTTDLYAVLPFVGITAIFTK